MNILIIENLYADLEKSRFSLGEFLKKKGYEVRYACPNPTRNCVGHIPMDRNSFHPIQIFKGLQALKDLEKENDSDIVLSFRLMPNFLSYLSSFYGKPIKRVAVITGLGYAFTSSNLFVSLAIKKSLITIFYRLASKRIQIVTQNKDDLVDLGIKNAKVILGSGVSPVKINGRKGIDFNSIRLLFVGRLLKSKGILTAIEIFEKLRILIPNVTLTIAGTVDKENPDTICETDLKKIIENPGIKFLGFVEDMNLVYPICNVLLFPSTYREGVPRVIIESLMHGLTIVTRDLPGCKETVRNNGFILSNKNELQDLIIYLSKLSNVQLLSNQLASIKLYEEYFSSEVIYPQYESLLN
jgi:glycosyltransferase involved in cell wall biosynthesis